MAKNVFEIVQNLLLFSVLLAAALSAFMQIEDRRIRKGLLWALLGFFVITLVLAFLRDKRIIKYKQINNIYLLVASLLFGLVSVILGWIDALKKHPAVTIRWAFGGTLLLFVSALMLYRLPTILVMPFHFLGKDDTYFSTFFLARITGFLLAFLVLALIFLAVYKIISRVGKSQSRLFLTVFYLISGFVSFVGIVGIINSYYRRKIKLPNGLRIRLPQLITAENALLFVSLVILALVALSFIVYNCRIHGEYANPAEHRRLRAFARNNRRWGALLLVLAAFTWVDFTAIKKASQKIVELSPSEDFQLDGSEIFIPLTQVSDGHLHRFTWTDAKGKGIRFIIVQKKGMNFGIGFDACDICGNVGYYERKNEIVCNRCDVVMNKSTIGLKGGCNPVPLDSRIERGGIIIDTADLEKEAGRF